ncbi:hypothetical protein FQA39_LY08104 [Lamprigera yunnana]|nr:hypothetical protein FQA39_LY08104 [Lamprigera yunnana]
MAVLGHTEKGPLIQHMWDQEKAHRAKFEELIRKYRVRPTVMTPIWNVAGFVLGAGSALLGDKAAMACTVAVETVIVEHYNDQLRELMQDPNTNKEVLDTIKQFRDEEQEHHDIGIDHGAEQAPFYKAFSELVKFGCKTAISISKFYLRKMENAPENNGFHLNREDLLKKHRQERKELQASIQALKKTAIKGDRKKKKEVAETILQLEKELEEKHSSELENVLVDTDLPEAVIEDDGDKAIEELLSANKISRAQKRRNKKEVANKERDKRVAEEEKNQRHGPRVIEINKIKEILQNEGLQIYNIPADGNCLYCAVNHQLDVTGRTSLNIEKLRKLTATFMHDNKEDFLPFMYDDNDEIVDEEKFDKYCNSVANTKLWGGQLEITALSKALKCPIKVIQGSGPITIQGELYQGPPLILTYHKHLYRLGEHYNSTTNKIVTNDSEDGFEQSV